MVLLKCYTQHGSKFGKLSSGHRAGKGQFSFQSQRRAMPKNVQTTGQSYSFHIRFCFFLTCTQVSQEAGKVVQYSHPCKNFPVCCDPHSQRLWHSKWSRSRCFSGSLLLFLCWMDVSNLISGSSSFSKSSLNIWKFLVHVLLKPSLENLEYYFASVWHECNCVVVEYSLALPFFGIGMKTDLFQLCGHCWVFQICCHVECSTLTAPSFRIWNNSAAIPSLPLAMFVVMLPNAHLTS